MKTLHTIYNNFAKRNLSSLRFLLVMFLTLTITTNAWSAEGDKHTFTDVAFSKLLNNSATIGDVTISDPKYPVKTIIVNCRYNKTAGGVTISIKIGGKTFASSETHNSDNTVDIEFTDEAMQGDIVFSFVNNCGSGTSKGTFYFNSVTLVEGAPAAPCTVTLMDDESTLTQSTAGATITLPSRDGCEGYTFAGWTKSWSVDQTTWTTTAPTIIPAGSYTPTADESLYPVYTKSVEDDVESTLEDINIFPSSFSADPLGSGNYAGGKEYTATINGITFGGHYIAYNNANTPSGASAKAYIQMQKNNGNLYNITAFPGPITKIAISQNSAATANLSLYVGTKQLFASDNTQTDQTPSGDFVETNTGNSITWEITEQKYTHFCLKKGNEGTCYISSILITYLSGGGSTTSYISVPDCDPCNALQAPNVTAKNITTNSFTLSWDPVAGATSYNIYNYTTDEGYETTDLTYTFNGLDPNTEYEWEVEAVSATCDGKGTTGTTTTLKTYTITWKNADGSVLETDENVPHGTTPTYNGATPTKTATAQYTYTFSDWLPTIYAADKDQIYTAQFDETTRQYTVTFDANGHGTAPDEQSVDYGTKATEPTAPTAFGYTFGGWYKESECTNAWNFATDVVTGNITLYAKWTEKALTRYRTDCDACIPLDGYASIDGTYHFFQGETITLTVTPPADDVPYTYQWQKKVNSDYENIEGEKGLTYTKENATTSDVGHYRCVVSSEGYCDLTPEFDVKCLQLYVYYDNKSDVFNAPLKKVDGATATIDVELQNANYTYYFKITDGCGNWYGNTGTMVRDNCTNWPMDVNEYCGLQTTKFGTYVFNVNYSDLAHLTVSVIYPAAYQAAGKEIYLDNNVLNWTHSNNAEGKNKIYYRIGRSDHNSKHAMTKVPGTANLYKVTTGEYDNFEVWHIANNGCWSEGHSIFKTKTGDDWAATQATAFETLPVTSDVVTVTPTTLRSVGGDENNNNCKFYNYNITEGMKTWNAEVIEPTNGTITVKYTHHDGTAVNDFTSGTRDLAHTCLLTITATADPGYSLTSLTVNDEPFNSGDVHTLTANAVIKAEFTINTHVLTWNVNGGNSLTGEYTQGSVDYGTPIVQPADPTHAGHTFKGWIDQNGQTTVQTTMPDYDLTYTAQWQINQYTVTLNPNYPDGKTGTLIDNNGNTVNQVQLTYEYNTPSMPLTDLYQSIELEGYQFDGWYNAKGSTEGTVSGSKWENTGNITIDRSFYAKWTKLYGITLSENGTTKELEPQTSTSYTLPTELSVGTCDNDENELVGWSTVIIPTPGDKPTTDFYDLGETVTLTEDQTTFYAVFAKPGEGGDDIPLISFLGGVKSELLAIDGISASGLGSDYAESNAPYRVKLDNTDDYILYTNTNGSKITKLYLKVKMIGGDKTSQITVQTSNDNENYKDISYCTISGDQNAVNDYWVTVNESPKYLRLLYTRGSNVGLGNLVLYTHSISYFDYTTTCLSKHSITYDFNGGEGNCENEKVTHGEDYTICDEEPTNAGYTFLYWANGEDTYAPGTTIENVQADITLTATWQEREKYTLTFNDQGDTKEFQYIESLPVEMQEPWADICSGPIQYVFDGWATASVNNGTAEYEKVDFSTFTMPAANTTLYAVYRYAEDGGEPVNGFVKVTEALTDWSGDYVIVDVENLLAIKNAYRENTSSNKTLACEAVVIENDQVISPSANIVWTFSKNGETGYTMYSNANNMYAGVTGDDTRKAILSSEVTDDCIFEIIFNETTNIVKVSATKKGRCFQYYETGAEWRTYSSSSYNTGYLYRLSEKTILYTSSLICGSITAEDALVTSTKDQKVKVKVPITLESSTGATTINATSDNAAFDVTGLTDVEEGDHTIVIEYTPAEYNITETANITLSATNGATTTFTVSGRSLPEKFAMVVEKDGKFYALPANMPEAATYAGYEVEVKDNAIVTAPATYVYSLSAVHNSRYADYGTAVRFVGNDNKCLWASKEKDGTNIRNFAEVANATSDQYEWNLSTTDGERYTISSSAVADAERILRLYNQKFGMYKNGVSEFYFLPLMASTEDAKVLSSAFSVSETEKVQFSAGNLQYHTGDKAWRFAPEQYDYVGDDNANIGEPTFEGWIDMFGWSADGKYGVNTSINNDDYQGEFVDWGTLFPDEWYTLSMNEWYYLLNTRTNAANLKQLAKVGDVYGVLLFPDEWVMPYDVATPSHDEFNRYSYSLEDWQKLEIAGAVFLPAAGRREENHQYNTNEYIYYWTSTKETQDKVYYLISCNALGNDQYEYALPQLWYEKGLYGQSVRLARKLMPLQVVEWKENSVVVMYNGDPAQTATVTINNVQKGSAMLSEVEKDKAVYELPATGLASSPNQPLEIAIGTAKVTMTIPYIATATTTNVVPNNSDLVVLKDATFTATNEQLRNVTVYGGGTLVVGEGATLSTNSLTLRAGGVTADGNYDYVYPQFVLNGTWTNTSEKINLDYLTTKEQYYTFVAPFEVQTKDIHYPVDIYGSNIKADNKGSFEFEYYDGATRATGVSGWTTVEEGAGGATLKPGQGYTFLGMPKKVSVNGGSSTRQKFGIHRIPMTVTAEQAMTHENSEQTITVAPHPAEKNINAGWNLIGNPYMSTITGLDNQSIQIGRIVWNDNKWEWSNDGTSANRFIVFPSNDGQWYTTLQVSNAKLPAFKNFFVQIIDEATNALVIPYTSRTNPSAAPARHAAEEIDRDIELAIVLEKDEQNADQMDFLLNNTYGPAFDRNADFTKMMNNTNFNLYGVHIDDCLSFVAIDQYTAAQPVAIGYQVPTAGEYMLRMSDKPYVMADRIKALYVTDHEMTPEVTTDILKEPYRFTVGKAETNHTRFTISIELKPNTGDGVTTGWENVDVGKDQPIKFIYQDKLYILRNGVIYDATGKFVQTINK